MPDPRANPNHSEAESVGLVGTSSQQSQHVSRSPILFIGMFGGLRVQMDGLPEIGFKPQKTALLLAYLVLKQDRVHNREELADIIWPDTEREEALRNLRQSIYSIRRQLDPGKHGLIVTTGNTLALNRCLIRSDVDLYEETLRCSDELNDSSERARLLAKAVEIYAAELLPGFYLDAIIAERNRLSLLQNHALIELAKLNMECGNLQSAIECAGRAVEMEPFQEDAHRLLMEIYSRAGRSHAAVRQYNLLERLLQQEFGTAPSEATQGLLAKICEIAPARGTLRDDEFRILKEDSDDEPGPNDADTDTVAGAAFPTGMDSSRLSPYRRQLPGAVTKVAALAALFVIIVATVFLASGILNSRSPKSTVRNAAAVLSKSPTSGSEVWHVQFPFSHESGRPDGFRSGDISCEPTAITSDEKSNVYVAGFINTKVHDVDFLTLKYDPDGHLLWQARYNGPGNDLDRARFIAVAPDGCVYVAGESSNGEGAGSRRLKGLDIAIVKYDANGKPSATWPDIGFGVGVRRYNGPTDSEDTPCGMLLQKDGSIVVAGSSWESRLKSGFTGRSIVVLKYASDGNLDWKFLYDGGHGDDFACGLAQDADRNIVLAGATRIQLPAGPQYNYLTLKLSNSGARIWERQWGGKSDNIPHDVGVDSSGNIYVVGMACNSGDTPDAQRRGCITVKYTPDGQLCWARGTCDEQDRINRIVSAQVTNQGEVAVAGFGQDRQGIITCRTVYRDENGQRVWAADYGGSQGEDGPSQVAVGTASKVYVCGGLRQKYDDLDSYTLCYSHLGELDWNYAADIGMTHDADRATAVALTPEHDPVAAFVTYSTHSIHIIRYRH